MPDDLTSKIPFQKSFQNIKELLSHVQKIDSSYFAVNTLRLFLDAAGNALSMVLSARILELLYLSAPMEDILRPLALLLAVPSLISLTSDFLWYEFVQPKREHITRVYDGDLFAKFQTMDYSLIDSPYVKDIADRINKAHNWGGGIGDLFWKSDAFVHGICTLLCSGVVAFPILKQIFLSKSLSMYLGFAVLIVILYILTAAIAKANLAYLQNLLRDYSNIPKEIARKYCSFTAYWSKQVLSGNYHFIKDIHLYDGYDLMKKYTVDATRESEEAIPWASVLEKISGKLGGLQGAAEGFMSLTGYLLSAGFAISGAFSIGNVIKFAGSITGVLTGFQHIAMQYDDLSLTGRREAVTREMLAVSDEMYKGKLPIEKRQDNQYEIEFRNVSFCYPGTEKYALKDFSLKLRIGERLAIVGMNGSGKTTMIKLLCRLYDPQEGEILLNGVDIRKFQQNEYRKLFSVVFQDFKLLSLPLGQNVAAALEVDRKRAVEALRLAGLEDMLLRLPKGLDTFLYQDIDDDGVEISGGEAQKIALARALYKNAPFVLLDEPTASLDPLSEYEIYSGFDAIAGGKTAIYISHRLSSCRFCQDIAVFHEGRLIQRGSHEELLKDKNGKYYELWNAQAQYYKQ